MTPNSEKPFNQCVRCGTCCLKGGPALHEEDAHLVEAGHIPLDSLYTLRKGELAKDNVTGGFIRLDEELIKIKSKPGVPACRYYDNLLHCCRIYDVRPMECRVLECWDTTALIQMYQERRLNRKKVLKAIPWVLELIDLHEKKCDFQVILGLISLREKGDPAGAEGLQTLVNQDAQIRWMLIEKGRIDPQILDFLLGRPLSDILELDFAIKVILVGTN